VALKLFRNRDDFLKEIKSSPGVIYTIFSIDTFPVHDLIAIESTAEIYDCLELTSLNNYQQVTSMLLKDLLNNAFKYDSEWSYSFSSKVPLAIKNIQDINKILFFDYLYKQGLNNNFVFFFNDLVIEDLFQNCIKGKRLPVKKIFPTFTAYGRMGRTLLRKLLNGVKCKPCQLVFISLGSCDSHSNIDVYFGDLQLQVSKKTTSLTVYLAAGDKFRLPSSDSRVPIESFSYCSDIGAVFLATIHECFFRKGSSRSSQINCTQTNIIEYLKEEELRSGDFFMLSFYGLAFKRMFGTLNPSTLVFPFENRSWEKKLVLSAKLQGVTKCVGYQHSSLTKRHLAFEMVDNEKVRSFMPDLILTVGNVTADYLRALSPLYGERMVVLGSLRRVVMDRSCPMPNASILVALSSSFSEALRLVVLLNRCSGYIDIPVIIRSHPTIPINELFDSLVWPSNITLSKGVELIDDISSVSLVVYSSATVSLEGMLYGRLPIFVDIADVPDGDPLIGNCPVKYTVNFNRSLPDVINEYISLGKNVREELSREAIKYAMQYLQEMDRNKYNIIVGLCSDVI
jgi:hypothetical protein